MSNIFQSECEFKAGATGIEAFPPAFLPEIAFVGRSNVGKSSLLNMITGRRSLARTSKTPGCTRQANFFSLGGRIMIVDLPGYGFAKVSKKERKGWESLISGYLYGRATLSCVFVLLDSRHELKDSDRDMMSMLDDAGVSYRAILTKADKTPAVRLDKWREEIAALGVTHTALHPEAIATSAVDKTGIKTLRGIITGFC